MSSEGHDRCSLFGLGKSYHRNDAERLGHLLVLKHILAEHMVIGNHDNVISYLKLGPKALDFLQSKIKVQLLDNTVTGSNFFPPPVNDLKFKIPGQWSKRRFLTKIEFALFFQTFWRL